MQTAPGWLCTACGWATWYGPGDGFWELRGLGDSQQEDGDFYPVTMELNFDNNLCS